jgi:hypothetical protein
MHALVLTCLQVDVTTLDVSTVSGRRVTAAQLRATTCQLP